VSLFEKICVGVRDRRPGLTTKRTQASTVTLEMSGLLPLLEEVDKGHAGMNEPQ
jgi:hypothetical protein